MVNNYELKTLITKLEDRYRRLVNSELESYRNILTGIKNVARYLPVTKPRSETIPAIFEKSFDENFISDYLAFVLDPKRNGIGSFPLIKIFEFCKKSQGIETDFVPDIIDAEVTREFPLEDGGRIDILVKTGEGLILGIENKITARETGKQTINYAKSINREFRRCETHLLYLTPDRSRPSSKKFTPIAYEDLLNILENVNLNEVTDFKKLIIYKDFLNHIKEYIMVKRELKINEKTKLYIEHSDMIDDLWESVKKDSSSYFNFIADVIRDVFPADAWDIGFKQARSYQQIEEENWILKDIWVHFEFWLGAEDLFFMDSIRFMVDVEGKKKKVFLDLFEREYTNIKDKYKKRNILYRPSHRSNAIGFKEFKLPKRIFMMKPTEIESFFIKMSEEFSFLIGPIDKVLAKIGK